MKHIKIILFTCLLAMTVITKGQDFEPSQQAQGYLNDKNVTVDYSTGIFHYKFPLYSLGSGDFQLPVCLEYVAKGVKQEDQEGLIDHNWTLNTGGVVTRTIRGGIADEDSYYGYLWAEASNNAIPLKNDVTSVNKRDRDGESDIFTAVFNGQSVNFIIRMDQNRRIYAEPLERTNVRIECETRTSREIDGWIVTDDSGNRFIYRQKEWYADIIKDDAISLNGVRGQSYVSSWYLNRVEPCNGEPIIFNYIEEVKKSGEQQGIKAAEYSIRYKSKYEYGRAMQEYAFDFSKYRPSFNEQISEAKRYLGTFSMEMQLNAQIVSYQGNGAWANNPNFETNAENIESNFRIMGQIANFSEVTEASSELVKILDRLAHTYQGMSSQNAKMAAACFSNAKSEVIRSLKERINVKTKEVFNGTRFDIRSPLLKNIYCAGKSVWFTYKETHKSKILTGIRLEDMYMRRISEVVLDRIGGLSSLRMLDKKGQVFSQVKFDYYRKADGINLMPDIWGYPRKYENFEDEMYSSYFDGEYSKIGSLKTITTPNGGKMTLDYELNRRVDGGDFGGIRIKSLFLEDTESKDTIYYRYPLPGRMVYDDCAHRENVHYAGFSDKITHTRIKYWGLAFLNTGNNGIYYPYVQEIVQGKGTKAYLFNVPPPRTENTFAFWMVGLPLATAVYDKSGNLKQLVKYKYSSGLIAGDKDYFCTTDTIRYKYSLPQVKAHEYYMDREYLDSYYKNQKRLLLYQDGSASYYLDPYNEYFLPNIKPRTSVNLPDQVYYIRYGGKTLLKEQVEYRFETHVTDSPSHTDFSTKTSGIPFQKMEYFYDNLRASVHPTRVIRTDSKGDSYSTVTRRVTEISDAANSVIMKMKQKNLLTPVVKELQLKGDIILHEKVSLFDTKEADTTSYFGLSRQYAYYPTSTVKLSTSSLLSPDASLFTQGQANYLLEQTLEYEQKNHSYTPVTLITNSDQSANYYDFNYCQVILKAKHANYQAVTAMDLKKYDEASSAYRQISGKNGYYSTAFKEFFKTYQKIDVFQQPEDYVYYYRSLGHRMMIDVISVITGDKPMSFESYKVLVDSVRANDGRHANEFHDKYRALAYAKPELRDIAKFLNDVRRAIFLPIILDPNFLKFNDLVIMDNYMKYSGPNKITFIPDSKRLKLFVLVNGSCTISYTVEHSGGTTSGKVDVVNSDTYTLRSYDLDLTSYTGIKSVTVNEPSVAYLAVVPGHATFEAVSYNLDGSIFCKFDHTGQAERYEYDDSGRLVKVFDQDGNLLRNNSYNVIIR